MTVLRVENLGKSYREYSSEWQRFAHWFGLAVKPRAEHWVLRDINFDIAAGQAVGIIGQNGAGKSTLLKLITGTLAASEGGFHVGGRISAILELGMGFNPDLTGRKNAAHSLGLMGFTADQIRKVMPEVHRFAEIDSYFDEPVRIYSSGMQMRVAFAVATAYRPELLIVDEALSVGDAYFQHKSFDRIRQFQAEGTTLLIVSHDRSAIQSLCDRAILLESGAVVKDAGPEEVFDYYNALIAEREGATIHQERHKDGRLQTISGSGEVRVESVALLNSEGDSIDYINVGEPVQLSVKIRANKPLTGLVFGYSIKDRLGQDVFGTNTHHLKTPIPELEADQCIEVKFTFAADIGIGSYSISTALHLSDNHLNTNFEWKDMALIFNVINSNRNHFVGLNWIPPTVEFIK